MIIYNNIIPVKGFTAINIMGIIFIRNDCKDKINQVILNHEKIHTAQIREMLFIPFYFAYVLEWITRLFVNKNAYRNISFERECYDNQHNLDYLKTRKFFNWINYIIWNKN